MSPTSLPAGRRERLALAVGIAAALVISAPGVASAGGHHYHHGHLAPISSWHPKPISWPTGGTYNGTGHTGTGTSVPPRAAWHHHRHHQAWNWHSAHSWWSAALFFCKGWWGSF